MKAATGRMLITPIPPCDPYVALYKPIAAATPKMIIHSGLVCLPTAGKALVGRRSTSANAQISMISAATASAQKKYSSGVSAFTVGTYLVGPVPDGEGSLGSLGSSGARSDQAPTSASAAASASASSSGSALTPGSSSTIASTLACAISCASASTGSSGLGPSPASSPASGSSCQSAAARASASALTSFLKDS